MSKMSLTSNCEEGVTTRWVETEVEHELPTNWKKFVCMKGNKPIKKLTKYQDPAGINYSNLKSAVNAFIKTKPIGLNRSVGDPTLKSNGKRKSLPVDLQDEDLSPSKRQNIVWNNEHLVKSKPRHSLSLPLRQESASNKRMVNSNNYERSSSIHGLDKPKMCHVCSHTGFSSDIELFKHLRSEHFTCNLCNVMYESLPNLQVHMKDQHGVGDKPVPVKMKFQCELCKQKYQTLEFLNKHRLEDHLKSPAGSEKVESEEYSCNFCNIIFGTSKLLRKHNRKQHGNKESSNTSTGPKLPLLSSKPRLPPGPALRPADGSLQPSSNYEKLTQPGGLSKNIDRVTKEKFGRVVNREILELGTKGINIFPCAECGDEFDRKKDLKKHKKTHKQKFNVTGEDVFPGDVFEQTDDLGLQNDHGSEQNIEVDQSLFVSKTPLTAISQEEQEDYYDENEDFEEDVTELEDAAQLDTENWQENEYDEELDQEEYYDIENEHDDIEVISTGINKLPKIHDEIEVVEDSSSGIRFDQNYQKQPGYQIQKVQKQQTLNTIQSRYNQITITNNVDISDDEDGAFEDEDYSDFSDEELETGVHEEITLDDEPEEITLDEDEEIEDIVVLSNRKDTLEQDNMSKIEKYETMVANTDFVKSLTENPEKLFIFKQSAWYAQPPSWKPTKLGEVWNATVPQVCFYYKLHDYPLRPEWSFTDWSWEKFDDFMTPLVERVNPGKPASSLYKLKKAKWFLLLDPVIPEELRVTVETLEEEELGDELDILTL